MMTNSRARGRARAAGRASREGARGNVRPDAVALTLGLVSRRTVFELRQFD